MNKDRKVLPHSEKPDFKERDLPPFRAIVSPPQGWAQGWVYLVWVSYNAVNPIHPALLHCGFLNEDGTPGAYSEIWTHNYDCAKKVWEAYFVCPANALVKL